jgi:histidinol-phosphate aminotransferase
VNLENLFRPSILSLQAYTSARSLATDGNIFLDANESATAPDFENEAVGKNNLNRYPSPQPKDLLSHFSRIYGVPTENILIGRGSDEAIDLLTRALCEPGKDAILITPPTYGMYKVSADIQNVKTLTAPLIKEEQNWLLDKESIQSQISANTKLIYICSPNNPTGTAFNLEDIKDICQMAKGTSLVVLDEAYGEFAESQSGISLLSEFKNLVILRTLSKSWGLAGLRCGVLLGATELIGILQKVRAPYPLPQPVIELAVAATTPAGEQQMRERLKKTLAEKTRLQHNLEKLSEVVRVFPSKTNFLLVEFKEAQWAMDQAQKQRIILRNRTSEINNCVRITVGTPKENDQLLSAFTNKDSL